MNTSSTIAISWHRLPPYAAHLIRAGIDAFHGTIHVIASKPVALIEEVEAIIGQPIHWVDAKSSCSWSSLDLRPVDIFFQSGWLSQAFKELGEEVKRSGGKAVCFSDNSWKNSPRQWAGAMAFRAKYRSQFDAVWVPGQSGAQLMRFYGMSSQRIYQGMYGANPNVFKAGTSLENREKRFVFVGQLIERKGLRPLIEAFKQFHAEFPDWVLQVIGRGPLKDFLDVSGIECEGFQSPQRVAQVMRESRFLILPSYEDHWGLVVHEAAASGCGLIVSSTVGAALDLINDNNGYLFTAGSQECLYEALAAAVQKDDFALRQCFETSLSLSKKFGPQVWAKTFNQIAADLTYSTENLTA